MYVLHIFGDVVSEIIDCFCGMFFATKTRRHEGKLDTDTYGTGLHRLTRIPMIQVNTDFIFATENAEDAEEIGRNKGPKKMYRTLLIHDV